MADTVKHHDFIELDYTGSLQDGTVFDTTKKDVAANAGIDSPNTKFSPAIVCVGEKQLLPGLDAKLEGQEVGKTIEVELKPEDAFGKRDVKKMRVIPMQSFKEHKTRPEPGLQINVDGEIGTVTRVAGGRVIVNFNHPLAGQTVKYVVTVNRKVTDPVEQIKAFLNMTLKIKEEAIGVEVKEDKAQVELPAGFPQPIVDLLQKKLSEIVSVKELTVSSKSS